MGKLLTGFDMKGLICNPCFDRWDHDGNVKCNGFPYGIASLDTTPSLNRSDAHSE